MRRYPCREAERFSRIGGAADARVWCWLAGPADAAGYVLLMQRWLLGIGIALVVLGLLGVVGLWVLGGAISVLSDSSATSGILDTGSSASSLGRSIFESGVGEDGPVPRSVGRGRGQGGMMGEMMGGGCADCHGSDGAGGELWMMGGGIEVPDIRYGTLSAPHVEDGERHEAWDDEDIARAVRTGVEPDGDTLRPPMPRWDLTDREVDALIAYLKELSRS